jgi:hypothetical protein
MIGDALDEPKLLVARCMVDATLKNTAAMSVGANLNTVVAHGVKDELGIKGRKSVEALLNNMVAVEVLDEFNDSETKGLDDDVNLLRGAHILNHLLERACTVLIERNADHILGSVLNQSSSLIVIAELKELLAQIITKRVRHELNDVLVGFVPNHVNLVGIALLELLLEVATAMLVLAKLVDCTYEGVKGHVLEAGHGYIESQYEGCIVTPRITHLRCQAGGDAA